MTCDINEEWYLIDLTIGQTLYINEPDRFHINILYIKITQSLWSHGITHV